MSWTDLISTVPLSWLESAISIAPRQVVGQSAPQVRILLICQLICGQCLHSQDRPRMISVFRSEFLRTWNVINSIYILQGSVLKWLAVIVWPSMALICGGCCRDDILMPHFFTVSSAMKLPSVNQYGLNMSLIHDIKNSSGLEGWLGGRRGPTQTRLRHPC